MLKVYRLPNGHNYQFEEGTAPKGAVLVTAEKKAEKPNKAAKPANKSKKAAKK